MPRATFRRDSCVSPGAGLLAAWRYHAVNRQIERGWDKADRPLIVLVTILVVALATAFVVYFQHRFGRG